MDNKHMKAHNSHTVTYLARGAAACDDVTLLPGHRE